MCVERQSYCSPLGNLPITFWESTTSQRFVHKYVLPAASSPSACRFSPDNARRYGAKAVAHKYSRVHCVFNAHNLWANVARDDSVAATSFDLHNPSAWKAMDASVISQVFRNRAPCIKPSTINVADIERRFVPVLGLALHFPPLLFATAHVLSFAALSRTSSRPSPATAHLRA